MLVRIAYSGKSAVRTGLAASPHRPPIASSIWTSRYPLVILRSRVGISHHRRDERSCWGRLRSGKELSFSKTTTPLRKSSSKEIPCKTTVPSSLTVPVSISHSSVMRSTSYEVENSSPKTKVAVPFAEPSALTLPLISKSLSINSSPVVYAGGTRIGVVPSCCHGDDSFDLGPSSTALSAWAAAVSAPTVSKETRSIDRRFIILFLRWSAKMENTSPDAQTKRRRISGPHMRDQNKTNTNDAPSGNAESPSGKYRASQNETGKMMPTR